MKLLKLITYFTCNKLNFKVNIKNIHNNLRMNKLTDFMVKRKKDKRQSLIIDNFSYNYSEDNEQHNQVIIRRNSLKDQVCISQEESSSVYSEEVSHVNSLVHRNVEIFEEQKYKYKQDTQKNYKKQNDFNCTMCKNERSFKNDQYIILSCNHMFHVECLVDIHFDNFDKFGRVIDKKFCENCRCLVCDNQMEIEDIVHIHNKFTKTTKEYIKIQDNNIDELDKKLSKLKDEMRNLLEYKQKLEQKREKSKQITITLNNLID